MRLLLTITALLLSPVVAFSQDASATAAKPDQTKKIRVYILAGQSNMEGKAKLSLMEYQAKQPGTAPIYAHLRADGKWKERPDVWIKFLDRKGPLTAGFGSPNCIGPELEFGQVVGDHFEEPVLLIKTAWGGRSLYRDFRSPGAGFPEEAVLQKMLNEMQKKTPQATLDDVKKPFGASYRAMLDEIQSTLQNLKTLFPEYAGQGYELSGFIWFQGWNDMINTEYTAEYTQNLRHLIRDVRKDLQAPQLPFVVGQMGIEGLKPSAGLQKFKDAQAAVMEEKEFEKNVAVVKTDLYWDLEAEAVYKKGWRQNIEEWNTVGSDFPFHYLGSAKTLIKIGRALGEAVLELQGVKPQTR